jgi:hypothetical protein
MESHKILFVVFLVFGLIGAIRISDPVGSDDLFFMHVNVNNEGTRNLDDLSVRVLFYDLGIILQTNSFDLDDGDSTGNYLVRITVSNDDVREVRHRIVTIA